MKISNLYMVTVMLGLAVCINSAAQNDSIPTTASAAVDNIAREAITGAVASVGGVTLEKAPTNILSETLVGRLPGLGGRQALSELTFFGYSNFIKTIRGISTINGYEPLIIIDGVVTPTQYYEFISAKEIESVAVLKDAAATAVYGIQGAAGAIVINTKRGYETKRKVEAYADYSLQEVTRRPQFINSAQYARLRNEAGERDGLGAWSQFTQNQIAQFEAGDNPFYPNNNWYDMFVRKVAMRERAGVNVTGGSKTFRYFSNISFINQEQPFKTTYEPDRKYNPTPHVNVVNFRSNMDINFNRYVSGYMRLTGNVKREMQTGSFYNPTGSNLLYSQIFMQPPTMMGPVSPVFEGNEDISAQVMTVEGLSAPVYGLLNRSGYAQIYETNVIAQTGLNFNLDFITKGLVATGSMAYQTYSRNQVMTTQNFALVYRDFNTDPGIENDYDNPYNFKRYQPEDFVNTPLSYGDGHTFFYYLNLFGGLTWKRTFGQHSFDASAHTYYLMQEKESFSAAADVLPYKRQTSGLSLLYGYADRYYLKGDIGYSGSEQFAREHRYVATPAISAAWVASKEEFLAESPLSLLKFRASYGITANDQLGSVRFLYLDRNTSAGQELERGNPDLTAEKIKKLNIGLDLELKKTFGLKFDIFTAKIDNMLIGSANKIPEYQGVPLNYYAKLNDGAMENKGFEAGLSFKRDINSDISVFAEANFMYVRNRVINSNEQELVSSDAYPYAYSYRTEGYPLLQNWGLQIDRSNGNGFFNSQEEIDRYDLDYSALAGNVRVGDLIYKDLNGDHKIDERDMAPMGYSELPEQEFSLAGGARWKNWEVSFLFQGVNHVSFFLSGVGVDENYERYGPYSDLHLKAWTPERVAEGSEITFPALSLSPSVNHTNNDFFLQDGAYIRLKNAEIAYILPEKISRKIGSEKIRLMLNGQNLLTFDRMKTSSIDPEIRDMQLFSPFRVYNIGLSINF